MHADANTSYHYAQNPKTHKVTDFVSFYSLPSTIMNHDKHNLLNAAYLFYYATETAFEPGAEESGRLKKRLEDVVGDALVIAEKAGFDVFNALTLMDSVCFMQDLRVRSPQRRYVLLAHVTSASSLVRVMVCSTSTCTTGVPRLCLVSTPWAMCPRARVWGS